MHFLDRLLTRPLLATTGAFWFRQSVSGGAAVAVFFFSTGADGVRQCSKLFEGSTVQNTMEIPQFFSRCIFQQMPFLSRVIRAGFSALDHQEFLVIERSGVALTPGVSPRCQATVEINCKAVLLRVHRHMCASSCPKQQQQHNNNNNNNTP